jgi:hypothetical protein
MTLREYYCTHSEQFCKLSFVSTAQGTQEMFSIFYASSMLQVKVNLNPGTSTQNLFALSGNSMWYHFQVIIKYTLYVSVCTRSQSSLPTCIPNITGFGGGTVLNTATSQIIFGINPYLSNSISSGTVQELYFGSTFAIPEWMSSHGHYPTLQVGYSFNDNFGYLLHDYSGNNITASFGNSSSAANIDQSHSPSWASTGGLLFGPNQYITITTFPFVQNWTTTAWNSTLQLAFSLSLSTTANCPCVLFERGAAVGNSPKFSMYISTTGAIMFNVMGQIFPTTTIVTTTMQRYLVAFSLGATFAFDSLSYKTSTTPSQGTTLAEFLLNTPYAESATDIITIGTNNASSITGNLRDFMIVAGSMAPLGCLPNCAWALGTTCTMYAATNTCPSNQYYEPLTYACEACDQRCGSCTSSVNSACATCSAPYTLDSTNSCSCPSQLNFDSNAGTCGVSNPGSITCPNGTIYNPATFNCVTPCQGSGVIVGSDCINVNQFSVALLTTSDPTLVVLQFS